MDPPLAFLFLIRSSMYAARFSTVKNGRAWSIPLQLPHAGTASRLNATDTGMM
jgi:hypothetical protein